MMYLYPGVWDINFFSLVFCSDPLGVWLTSYRKPEVRFCNVLSCSSWKVAISFVYRVSCAACREHNIHKHKVEEGMTNKNCNWFESEGREGSVKRECVRKPKKKHNKLYLEHRWWQPLLVLHVNLFRFSWGHDSSCLNPVHNIIIARDPPPKFVAQTLKKTEKDDAKQVQNFQSWCTSNQIAQMLILHLEAIWFLLHLLVSCLVSTSNFGDCVIHQMSVWESFYVTFYVYTSAASFHINCFHDAIIFQYLDHIDD